MHERFQRADVTETEETLDDGTRRGYRNGVNLAPNYRALIAVSISPAQMTLTRRELLKVTSLRQELLNILLAEVILQVIS